MRSKNAKMEPRWAQDRSKIGPRSSWIVFGCLLFFSSFFDGFSLRFGAVLGLKMDSKNDWKLPLGVFLGGLGRRWRHLVAILGHLGPSWGHLGSSWGHLGAILGHLGAILGALGAISGPSWGHLAPSWGHLGRSWLIWAEFGMILRPCWDDLGTILGRFGFTFFNLLPWPGGLREAIK